VTGWFPGPRTAGLSCRRRRTTVNSHMRPPQLQQRVAQEESHHCVTGAASRTSLRLSVWPSREIEYDVTASLQRGPRAHCGQAPAQLVSIAAGLRGRCHYTCHYMMAPSCRWGLR